MYKRFSQLQFIIGFFFAIVAVILAVNAVWTGAATRLSFYTAIGFFIFGVAMMFLKAGGADVPD